jgi:hypothetical protein
LETIPNWCIGVNRIAFGLQAELLENRRYNFIILTSRFSQDCLENLFCSLRAKQIVPNALQVKNNFKQIALSQYLKNPNRSSSYQENDHDFLWDFLDTFHEQKPVHEMPDNQYIMKWLALIFQENLQKGMIKTICRLFCERKKENAVNEVNEEVILAYLFDLVSLFFLILGWNINQSRYSLRKCLVPRSGLNSHWLKQCWWSTKTKIFQDVYFQFSGNTNCTKL